MINNEQKAIFDISYDEKLKEQLKNKIKQYGSFSFDDDSWYCEKKHKNAASKETFTLYFHSIEDEFKEIVKYYALLRRNAIRTLQMKIYRISYFLSYFKTHFPNKKLTDVDRTIAVAFENHLLSDKIKTTQVINDTYRSVYDLFQTLNDFPELPTNNPFKKMLLRKTKRTKKDEKYIPKDVIKQWDRVMKNHENNIPLEVRCVYWLLRSFPNRIHEVLSLKKDCLKTLYSFYVLNVPTYKQNGGYDIEEIKTIPIVDTGHGKYIIELIKEMIKKREFVLSNKKVDEKFKDYLFITEHWTLKNSSTELMLQNKKRLTPEQKEFATLLSYVTLKSTFKTIAEHFKIIDANGELYVPTTHQFRHNAITDRLYLAGYTVEQTTKLTGHKNESMMLNSYTHQLKEKHKEALIKINELKDVHEQPVEFKGRIMNLDDKTTNILSKNPKAYLTWETNNKKGVGICSDILGCNPKGTSVHFECYACDWFVPKAEYLEDYQKEKEYWDKIGEQSENNPKRAAHFENAIRNITLLERIIKICENGIEKYKKEKEKMILEGDIFEEK